MHLIRLICYIGLFLSLLGQVVLAGQAKPVKVCAAENELPYSNRKQEGFENEIARLIADGLGRPLKYVWWKDPRYYIRDQLDKGLCDVVIGLDKGDPRVLTTGAYYRSGYVFVSRRKDKLGIKSWDQPRVRKLERIAFVPNTPAEVMIRTIGRYSEMFNYMHSLVNFKSRRNQYIKYDPAKLVSEVESGKAELAVLWGPAAARYIKQAGTPLEMILIPDNNIRADGEPVPHHYSTSMGVRKGEDKLLAELNKVLTKIKPRIEEVLKQEGIPLIGSHDSQVASHK